MAKQNLPVTHEDRPGEMMRPMLGLRDEIDRLFDDFLAMTPFRRGWFGEAPDWAVPMHGDIFKADVIEREDAYEIDIEVPGLDAKEVDISVADGCLTVRGESHVEKKEKKEDYRLFERHHGAFARNFRLPDSVDAEKIDASLAKGVLAITLPKKPEAKQKQRKIAVKAAD